MQGQNGPENNASNPAIESEYQSMIKSNTTCDGRMGTQELPRLDMNGMNGTVPVAHFFFQGLDFFQGTCVFFQGTYSSSSIIPDCAITWPSLKNLKTFVLLNNHDRVFWRLEVFWVLSLEPPNQQPWAKKKTSRNFIPAVSTAFVSSRIQRLSFKCNREKITP